MTQFDNSNEQTKRIRQIQVIFLRHGEREDETDDYDKHRKTRQERIDPALTILGHQQALGAWRKILAYVPKDKPIMVACSPLRRCIGTAMMVAAAAAEPTSARVSSVKFVLPTENNVNGQEQIEDGDAMDTTATDNETSTTIPMLVMNGLGDCAAQMGHMGGIGKVVKAGCWHVRHPLVTMKRIVPLRPSRIHSRRLQTVPRACKPDGVVPGLLQKAANSSFGENPNIIILNQLHARTFRE